MKNKKGLSKVIYKTVLSNKIIAFSSVFIILLSVIIALFPPLILEKIIDSLVIDEQFSLVLPIAYFLLFACSGLLESSKNVIITVFGQRVTHGLRSELCSKLKRLPTSYFTENEAGKITSLFVNDVDAVDSLFTNGIISMAADLFKVISILGVIFYKSIGLGILMLFVTPMIFIMTEIFQKKMLKAQLENRVAVSKVNNHIPETINNIRMIRTLFKQKYMEEKYDDYIEESYKAINKSNLYDSIYSPIVIFISSCVIAIMMIFAATGGEMQKLFGITVGTAVAIIAYVGKVFEPLESIGMEIQNIQSAMAGVKRIDSFLNENEREMPKLCPLNDAEIKNSNIAVEFKDVVFGYNNENTVLNNLSFTIKNGETVTLVGRTGAGKTTVFRLILGLYAPQSGRVLINGNNAFNIDDLQKRQLFGYVEQSFHLVSGTVAEQISLFDKSITQEQIEFAAKLIGLHENIIALENGYNTSAEKINFSQGQFQLLSIARAIVTKPKILLLDEITANLDSKTEQRVLEALKRACDGRTVISISHRLYEENKNQRLLHID